MRDSMLLITGPLGMGMQASWAITTSFHCCPTNLRGIYMSFMISCSRVSIFHPCQLIEAILICMEPSILIRFGSCCISVPACNMPVLVIIMVVQNIVIIVRVIITSNCILKNASTYTLFLCMRVRRSWSSDQARLCVLG
jgi:hypothetical protein